MRESTNVSIRGGKPLVLALKAVAAARGITVAELVRDAVDKQYGDELRPHLKNFSAKAGTKLFQTEP
jgi:predicted DNA-binding ribbon-helix-helix protein